MFFFILFVGSSAFQHQILNSSPKTITEGLFSRQEELLSDDYFCLYTDIFWKLYENGRFPSIKVTNIPSGTNSLVLRTNGAINSYSVKSITSQTQVTLNSKDELSWSALTDSQSLHKEEKGNFVSPVCKFLNSGPAKPWAIYSYTIQVYACSANLVDKSQLLISNSLSSCSSSTQTNQVYVFSRLLLAGAVTLMLMQA